MRVKKYSISNVGRVFGVASLFRMYLSIFLSRNDYASINIQWSVFRVFDLLFYFLIRNSLVFTFHNAKPHNLKRKRSIFDFFIFKLSKKIVFVSKYTMDEFLNIHSIKQRDVFLLNHGCMPLVGNEHALGNIVSSDTTGGVKAVFWGNVKEYKGVDFLVDSLERLKENKLDLEVYGKFDLDMKKYYEKLILNGCISVDDYLSLEDVANILNRPSVLVVLPYKNASQSGVMYNLLAHGVPFVSSRTGEAYRFLSENRLHGLTFEYGDTDSLIRAFLYFVDNRPAILERLKCVKQDLDWTYDTKVLAEIFG